MREVGALTGSRQFRKVPAMKAALAQFMLDRTVHVTAKSSPLTKSVIWRLRALTLKLLGLSDTLVNYELHGHQIRLPADSDLPSVLSRCPKYGRNLQQIAQAVSSKYPRAQIIDIGANVGDTAITMRASADSPILCVEASRRYAELCRENLTALTDVSVVNALVDTGATLNVRILERGGSGRIVLDEASRTPTMTLAEIAASHGYSSAKLVKIDTDGFDGRIIQASRDWLGKVQPVLFWELELTSDARNQGPGELVFDILEKAGYDRFMFYSNTGDYILTATAADRSILEDLSWYVGRREDRERVPPAFADVCAIAKHDADIYEEVLRMVRERKCVPATDDAPCHAAITN
jgi:FkbM family methyltransferase